MDGRGRVLILVVTFKNRSWVDLATSAGQVDWGWVRTTGLVKPRRETDQPRVQNSVNKILDGRWFGGEDRPPPKKWFANLQPIEAAPNFSRFP